MFTVSISTFATDEHCNSSRLDIHQSSLTTIPIWNQGKSNLCYAFAASVLIDHKRGQLHDEPLENFTSPLALAAQTVHYASNKSKRTTFWGGSLDQSISSALQSGTCNAGWISDQLGDEDLVSMISKLRKFHKQAYKKDTTLKQHISLEVITYLQALNAPKESIPKSFSIISMLEKKEDHFMGLLISSLCRKVERKFLPDLKIKERGSVYNTGVSMAEKLNDLLSNKKTPTAIEFCADAVTNPNFATGYDSPCARHYAVAVGQRMVNGSCEIRMRDSQCDFYNSIQEGRCENGHYWIKRKHILGNIDNISWL